jgi:hypothetical protein
MCHDKRSKLDLGFIISLPLAFGSCDQDISIESVFSASADAESVEATCPKCHCITANSRRSYVAVGAHVIIQLKRFRWNAALNTNAKVRKALHITRVGPHIYLTVYGNAQDSTSVALSPILKICTSPAPAPQLARNISDVASASRLLRFEGSDDDCQILAKNHISSHRQEGLRCQGDNSGSGDSISVASPFSLVGNVMHTGRTLDSGHYYTDVVCNGSWIRVNDTSVSTIDWDPRRVQSPSWGHMAYIQLYACSSALSRLRPHVPEQ